VRKFAAGEYATQSQELLNELAKAMLCLTDARRKAEYDASLGRIQTEPGKLRSVEQLLLARKVVDREALDKARSFADAVGVEMHDAVVQQKLAKPEVVMQIYAESLGLPYVDLTETGIDIDLVPQIPAAMARQHSVVPVMVDDGQALLASPHPLKPEVEDELRLRLGMTIRPVLCTVQGINVAINRFYSKEAAAAEAKAGGKPLPQQTAAAGNQAAPSPDKPKLSKAEQQKQDRLVLALSFCFTVMVVVLYGQLFKRPTPTLFQAAPLGLLAGAVVTGLTFVVLKLRK
jgi:hypothetical protein